MGSIYLRKYGVGTTVDFNLYKLDGTGLKTDAASAAGDITLYRDEAGVETLDADAFVDEGAIYSLVLSIAEMTAARIIVCIVDQTNPQVWLDKTLIIETYGDASAQHAFDLDLATQPVNLTQMGGVVQSATDLKDFADAGYDPATDKVTGVLLCDQTTLVDGVTLCDQTTLVDGVTLCDQTTLVNTVTLCNLTTTTTTATAATNVTNDVGITQAAADKAWGTAVRALTDKAGFSLAADQSGITIGTANAIAAAGIDSIWDEVMEGALTGRHAIKLMLSMLTGKCSGGGTATLTFRDTGDTKDRLVYTVTGDGDRTGIVRDGA